ncbi:MAG: HepT-like ribonuclease domain-containing protein [Candidatus Humimicrobiaceae bacterium]
MKNREYTDYLNDIYNSIKDIESFIKNLNFNEFSKDKKTLNAVIRSLEIIGEASKKIPANFKEKYPDIPWNKMLGMRNKLIHEYFGVDIEMLWIVITQDIQELKSIFKKIVES